MNRKKIVFILLGIVFLTGLLVCGYFGVKIRRRARLRHAAMTAYEKKDYAQAERLLLQYVQLDPDSEAEYAALADIYREYGNAEMEAQMWQAASSLNPQNQEYRNAMNHAQRQAGHQYRPYGQYGGTGNCSACDMCSSLICADCCCECMGGDLIPCC